MKIKKPLIGVGIRKWGIFFLICLFGLPHVRAEYISPPSFQVIEKSFSREGGYPIGHVYSSLKDQQGRVWFSKPGHIYYFEDNRTICFSDEHAFRYNQYNSILEDQIGRIFFLRSWILPPNKSTSWYSEVQRGEVWNPHTQVLMPMQDFCEKLKGTPDSPLIRIISMGEKTDRRVVFVFEDGTLSKLEGNGLVEIHTIENPEGLKYIAQRKHDGYWLIFEGRNPRIEKHGIANGEREVIPINYPMNFTQFVEDEESGGGHLFFQRELYRSNQTVNPYEFLSFDSTGHITYRNIHCPGIEPSRSGRGYMDSVGRVYWYEGGTLYFSPNVGEGPIQSEVLTRISSLPSQTCFFEGYGEESGLLIIHHEGIHILRFLPNLTEYSLEGPSMRGIAPLSGNKFFFNSYDGAFIYNMEEQQKRPVRVQGNDFFGLDTHIDQDGNLWVGKHNNQLYRFDTSDWSHQNYVLPLKDSMVVKSDLYSVLSIESDKAGTIWVGGTLGLYQFSPEEDRFFYVEEIPDEFLEISRIKRVKDTLWCIGRGKMAKIVNGHFESLLSAPTQAAINDCYFGKDGVIWLATKLEGIWKWNYRTGAAKQYVGPSFLFDPTINWIHEYPEDHFWLATNNGLYVFDSEHEATIGRFDSRFGFPSDEFNYLSNLHLGGERFILGGTKGFAIIDLHRFWNHLNQMIPEVVFKGAYTLSFDGTREYLATSLDNFRLTPQLNHLILEMGVQLEEGYASDFQLVYRVKGLSERWLPLQGNKLEIHNWPAGKYRLEVEARPFRPGANRLTIPIQVTPPFYRDISFWIDLMFLFLTLGTAWYWMQIRRERRLNELLNQEVEERTKEIQRSKDIILAQKMAIEEKNKELEKANAYKDQIFGIIAHDLRSPFLAIESITEKMGFLIQQKRFNRLMELGYNLEASAHRGGKIVQDLILLAKRDKGQLKYKPRKVNLESLTVDLIGFFQADLRRKNLTAEYTKKGQKWVWADQESLQYIIRNLLQNAIKFSHPGGQIHVSLTNRDANSCLIIRDEGVGFPKEWKEPLVDLSPLGRSEDGTFGEKGLGIGLILCMEMAQMNKGQLILKRPQAGEGAEVHLILPSFSEEVSSSKNSSKPSAC